MPSETGYGLKHSIQEWWHVQYFYMLLLGFSAGLPFALIFSSLSLWLAQAGLEKSSITYFSWAILGYSFKFLWSPLVDRIPIVGLTRWLGQKRSWMLLSQLAVISAVVWMGLTDPSESISSLTVMALAAVTLGFSAATQDISVDAWRIAASENSNLAKMSSLYVVGYRLGMVASGAGALFLAAYFGTEKENYLYEAWKHSYLIMASLMMAGVCTVFLIHEPVMKTTTTRFKTKDYLGVLLLFVIFVVVFVFAYRYSTDTVEAVKLYLSKVLEDGLLLNVASFCVSAFRFVLVFFISFMCAVVAFKAQWVNKDMAYEAYMKPLVDLYETHKKHAALLLGVIVLYRVSDIVMGVSANLFYQDLGFNLEQIAWVSKTYGIGMIILGAIASGFLARHVGVMRIMIIGAVASAATNLLFMVMAGLGDNIYYLVFLITADNLAQGFANTALVMFMSLLVSKEFTAVQYAIFSSIMTLFPKILGGYSGTMIDAMGYGYFFLSTAIMGIPVIVLLLIIVNKGIYRDRMVSIKG